MANWKKIDPGKKGFVKQGVKDLDRHLNGPATCVNDLHNAHLLSAPPLIDDVLHQTLAAVN